MCGRDSDREGRPSPPFTRPPSSRPKDLARSPIFHGPSAQRPGVGARGVMSVTVFHNRYLLFASPPPHLANIPHFPGPVLPTLSPCVPPPPSPRPSHLTLSLLAAAFYHHIHMSLYPASSPGSNVYMFRSMIYLFDLWRNLFFFFNGLIPFTFLFLSGTEGKKGRRKRDREGLIEETNTGKIL